MNTGDTAWVLMSTGLVLFMTIGLALFYGGMVRSQHALSMILQNVVCIGVVTLMWLLVTFSLAFDKGNGFIGGLRFLGLRGIDHASLPGFVGVHALTIPVLAFFHYHLMFAIITPALITGATADRLKFAGWAIFVGLWVTIIYAPVAHWIFSPVGWLAKLGVEDFAGGAVVHTTAGAAALALVLVLGPRRGWPKSLTKLRPNSMPLVLLGTGILWFGWFGFNAGSALGANVLAVHSLVNAQIGGAAGLAFWLLAERMKEGNVTSLGGASGAIAGLAAITPAAGFVGPLPALLIGALAGVICFYATRLKFVFRYDDALDVVGVHLVGGVLGMLLLSLFSTRGINPFAENGLFYGGGVHLIWLQALAVTVVFAYSFILSFILGKVIAKTIGLRVSPEEEDQGLDISHLVETAYQPPWFETDENREPDL
jgi:ammonium transporter, Amt family